MTDQLHVVCTGSRFWDNESIIREAISELPPNSRIAHGDCPTGADPIIDRVARELGHSVEKYPAEWSKYPFGAAGPIRNAFMARKEKPSICLAFLLSTAKNKGTNNCIEACLRHTKGQCEIRKFSE